MTIKVLYSWNARPLEIGIGFLLASFGAFFLGILFVFDRSLILMGNLAFFIGLVMLIGVKSTFGFFLKQGNSQQTQFQLQPQKKQATKKDRQFSFQASSQSLLDLQLLDFLFNSMDYTYCSDHSSHLFMIQHPRCPLQADIQGIHRQSMLLIICHRRTKVLQFEYNYFFYKQSQNTLINNYTMNDTQTLDSSRKRGVLKKCVSICQTNLRYDRNGKEIRIGAKYSITINPDILYHPAEQPEEHQLQQNQQQSNNKLSIQTTNNETDLLTQTSSQRNSQPRSGSRESKERLFDQMIDKTQRRKGKKKACCSIF